MGSVYDTTIVAGWYSSLKRNRPVKLGPIDYHAPLKQGETVGITIHGNEGDAVYDLLVEYVGPSKGEGSLPKVRLRCTNPQIPENQLGNLKGGIINKKV